jgi:hypothetical protein
MSIAAILMMIFVIVGILASIFWVWMLVEAATSKSLQGTEKIVWVLVILFLHVLGAALYYLIARKPA